MRLPTSSAVHFSYCLNIHPGERLEDLMAAVRGPATEIARKVAGDQPFGLGLRVADAAAHSLQQPDARASLKQLLAERNLYAFTINGFPYGNFHGGRVKEDVYKPDWRTASRAHYTKQLADLLADLLPDGVTGSISTVPGSYRAWIKSEGDTGAMVNRLLDVVNHLHGLQLRTGRLIQVALEPEPACVMETTDQFIAFFNRQLLPAAAQRGLDEAVVRRHIGMCLDTCHAAIAFEDPARSLDRLAAEGLAVPKVQLSAALRTEQPAAARETLRAYAEPVYLHQVGARTRTGEAANWTDLPNALQDPRWSDLQEARVHYHVPLFWNGAGVLRTTADGLGADFFQKLRAGAAPHIEVETYTFDVLPWGMRGGSVVDSVVREMQWALKRLA